MFFWKFTRSGKYSNKYISLILDFHNSLIRNGLLNVSFDECEKILILIQDVEKLNGLTNNTAGLLKSAYRSVVNSINFDTSNEYQEMRQKENLVLGKMVLGNHLGDPLDYGKFINTKSEISLDIKNLNIKMEINAKTGIIYGNEDKLKAYRKEPEFINKDFYFDLMPKHDCIKEIVNKMMIFDKNRTEMFLINVLKWKRL